MSDLIPGTAASLLLHGTITSHTNLTGDGEPQLHPAVRAFFDGLPPALRESFAGYCADYPRVSVGRIANDPRRRDGATPPPRPARPPNKGAAG
ncbi:hypothetical protein ACFU8I_40700, partial [Streptomyces sp. NPDC057540]|uniref:hypothetical protein n=1 Tax=Streptomyces sp. NPDC057540 TaxID=3346160 RepID=UPI003687D4EE